MTAAALIKVFYEPVATAHASDLYDTRNRHPSITTARALSEDGRTDYERDGVVLVSDVFATREIAAARDCLEAMTRVDSPACEAIWYEGGIRDRLRLDATRDHGAASNQLSDRFALGQEAHSLPRMAPAERARYVRKFMGFLASNPPLRAIANHPRLLALVRHVLGAEPRLFQEMAMIKPPGGREKPWHQDHAYFNLGIDERIVGIWIPLEEASVDNGCMVALRGAHKHGPRLHFKLRDWQLCDSDVGDDQRVALPMRPGEVMMFDGKLPHGTATNRTDQFRWAIQFHYVAAMARAASDDERLAAFGADGKNVTC